VKLGGQFAGYIDIEHDDLEEWLNIKTEGDPVQDIFTVSSSVMSGSKRWSMVMKEREKVGKDHRDTHQYRCPLYHLQRQHERGEATGLQGQGLRNQRIQPVHRDSTAGHTG